MNILYVHRTQGRGVEAVHIMGLVDAFEQLGHKVTIVSPPGVTVEKQETSNISKGPSVSTLSRVFKWISVHVPEILFETAEIMLNVPMYFRIKKILKKQKIHLVYERYALNTFAATLLAKQHNIPIISEVNDASFIERVRPLTLKTIARRIEQWVLGSVTGVVTISSKFKQLIEEQGISANKVVVTPNAVPDSFFRDHHGTHGGMRKILELEDSTVIGYVGAFVYWHRVDLLLSAFETLAKEMKAVKLLLVGDGVTYPEAKNYVEQHGLSDRVILSGRVPHKDIFDYIGAMDICVMPDSNEYGSPMKLFEYMAMGKAVVAPKLPPMEDVITSWENGVLFPRVDEAELVAILRSLVQHVDLRDKLGLAAKSSVAAQHTWTKNAEKVLSYLNGTLGGSHAHLS